MVRPGISGECFVVGEAAGFADEFGQAFERRADARRADVPDFERVDFALVLGCVFTFRDALHSRNAGEGFVAEGALSWFGWRREFVTVGRVEGDRNDADGLTLDGDYEGGGGDEVGAPTEPSKFAG